MKKIMLLIFLVITGISFSQNDLNIDHRLKDNNGENIKRIYEKQKSYYDFLLWELDHGYKIVNASSININELTILPITNIVNVKGVPFDVSVLDDIKNFNFKTYNFVIQKEGTSYYDLGNNKVIQFTSITAIWNQYREIKTK